MKTKSEAFHFLATIYKIWMMRHVDVPAEISHALAKALAVSDKIEDSKPVGGAKRTATKSTDPIKRSKSKLPKYIRVVALVNGRTSRTTLVPAGDGRYRMEIVTELRKAAHADVGDVVSIELRLDRESRELPVPADLRAALKERPKARKAFEQLPPGLRRQYINWFDSAKGAEARRRRLGLMEILLERAILGPSRRRPKSKLG